MVSRESNVTVFSRLPLRLALPRWFIAVLAVLSLLSSFGCGGGGGATATAPTTTLGVARIVFEWPEQSRVIPTAANSIRLALTGNGNTYSQVVARPSGTTESVITFNNIPVGTYAVLATAYASNDGTGNALATGGTSVDVLSDQTTSFAVTMLNAVTQVQIEGPAQVPLTLGTTYRVRAYDANNVEVLVAPSTLSWTVSAGATVTPASGSNQVTMTGTTTGSKTLAVAYTEPGEAAITRSVSVNVTDAITVSLSTPNTNVRVGTSFSVSATVGNATNSNVTWNVTGGTVTSSTGTGVTIQAPSNPGTITVTATSVQDPSKTATMTINVLGPVSVALSPGNQTAATNATITFTATVTNALSNNTVTWTVNNGATIMTSTGTTAQIKMPANAASVTVTATSAEDPTKSASSVITVQTGTGTATGTVRSPGKS